MTAFQPIQDRPVSIGERVYDLIRSAIVSQRLAPGERVTEAKLATELAVSKTPVREALLRLEYIGLIEADGQRGGRIITPSRQSIQHAYEIREGLECQAARIVAISRNAADIARLRELAETCLRHAEKDDRQGFRDYDRQVHLTLGEITRNPLLARMINDSFDLTWTLRQRDVPNASSSLACAKQHVDIVEALEDGDPDRAEAAMRAHVDKVQTLVFSAIDDAA